MLLELLMNDRDAIKPR